MLDTDIFSEFTRGRNVTVAARAAAYEAQHIRFTISVLTLMEVISGWHHQRRRDRIDELLVRATELEILPVTTEIATLAGLIHGDLARTGQPIGTADSLIAATALHHGLVLVTGNTAHYQRLQPLGYNLQLDNWRSP